VINTKLLQPSWITCTVHVEANKTSTQPQIIV
jgi:hypothetical protein